MTWNTCSCLSSSSLASLFDREIICFVFRSWSLAASELTKEDDANRVKWSAYLQEFTFVLRYKSGTENKVTDALSHCSHPHTTISIIVPGFEDIRREYPDDHDFWCIYKDLNGEFSEHPKFSIHDGYFVRGNQFYFPATIREYVLWELHGGGCSGHLGRDKTLAIVEDSLFWPRLKTDGAWTCELCRVC